MQPFWNAINVAVQMLCDSWTTASWRSWMCGGMLE